MAIRNGMLRVLLRHKALTVLFLGATMLGSGVAAWTAYVNAQFEEIPHFAVELERPNRPERVAGKAKNILLVGVDDGQGADLRNMLSSGTWTPGAFRSDVIMVLHLDADRHRADVISIPRDSFMHVDGLGMAKVNAAFSLGGPRLLASTVEDFTGAALDHVAIVDFEGFKDLTTALGGVDVYVAQTVYDSARDKTWEKGTHRLEGETALMYVRQRYGLPRGDFDRVQRQQNFLRAVLDKIDSTGSLDNPIRFARLVDRMSKLIMVDESLTPARLRELAVSARNLRPDGIRFVTVPVTGTPTIAGASVVTLNQALTRAMFDAMVHDRLEAWLKEHPSDELPAPGRVD